MNMAVDVAVHTLIMGDKRDGCRLDKRSTSICSSLGLTIVYAYATAALAYTQCLSSSQPIYISSCMFTRA
jgi:hypothetical protein